MQINPKVTVIIPVFNGEKFLIKTIESCLLQERIDLDIIIINDGSSDNSEITINTFVESNIIYINNSSNVGLMKSVNKAEKEAKGEFLCFLGQDDLLPPLHLATLVSEFEKGTSIVFCNSLVINENGEETGIARNDEKMLSLIKDPIKNLAFENFISSTGLVMRRSAFKKVNGYPEQHKNYGEWLMWLRLLSVGGIKYSIKSKAFYRRHGTNLTNSFKKSGVRSELYAFRVKCMKKAYDLADNKTLNFKIDYFKNRVWHFLLFLRKSMH